MCSLNFDNTYEFYLFFLLRSCIKDCITLILNKVVRDFWGTCYYSIWCLHILLSHSINTSLGLWFWWSCLSWGLTLMSGQCSKSRWSRCTLKRLPISRVLWSRIVHNSMALLATIKIGFRKSAIILFQMDASTWATPRFFLWLVTLLLSFLALGLFSMITAKFWSLLLLSLSFLLNIIIFLLHNFC